jgi:hypothetical protein
MIGDGITDGAAAVVVFRAAARRGAVARLRGGAGGLDGSAARGVGGTDGSGRFLTGDRFLAGFGGFSSDIQP